MCRFAITIAIAVACAVPAHAQVTSAIPPTPMLKREVTVAGDLVRIGDLVENAGAKAHVPVFRAPDLGHTGTVQTMRVIEAVRAHGLLRVDPRDISEVVVRRASRLITLEEIETQIAAALAGQHGLGKASDLVVTLDRYAQPLRVEATATAALQLTRLTYDARSRRFDASFDLPGSAVARRLSLRFLGSVVETAEAAVLVRALARGDVVRPADVVSERRPRSELGGEATTRPEAVVGLAARRALRAGHVLRPSDLMRPDIVHRNDPVLLIYQAPGIVLTLRGKALDSGAEGDVVSVLNPQSKRAVQGVVSGPGQVIVRAANLAAAADMSFAQSSPAIEPSRSE